MLYLTRDDFLLGDVRRFHSTQANFGVHWHLPAGPAWPAWTLTYLEATGEVAAFCQTGNGAVEVLGVLAPDPVTPGSREVFYRTLDRVLDGWAELADFDLGWVAARLAAEPADSGQRCRHCAAPLLPCGDGWTDRNGFTACVKGAVLARGGRVVPAAPVHHEPLPQKGAI